jgi:hypothetical protein
VQRFGHRHEVAQMSHFHMRKAHSQRLVDGIY